MAKFYGNIGFLDTVETEPGIWEETFQEKPYYGDLVRNTSRWQSSGKINDDISLNIVLVLLPTHMPVITSKK